MHCALFSIPDHSAVIGTAPRRPTLPAALRQVLLTLALLLLVGLTGGQTAWAAAANRAEVPLRPQIERAHKELRFDEMEKLARMAVADAQLDRDPARRQLGRAFDLLGTALHRRGKLDEAEKVFREAMEVRLAGLPSNDPDLAESYSNVAFILSAQDRPVDAEPFHRKALEIREKVGNPEDIALSLTNFGTVLYRLGKMDEAQPLLERAVSLYRQTKGDVAPETAAAIDNLANNLDSLDRPYHAEALYLEALEIRRKSLGPSHPAVALALNNLAYSLASQSRLEEARELLAQALRITRRALPRDHPAQIPMLFNNAEFLSGLGRHRDAEQLAAEAVEIEEHAGDYGVRMGLGSMGTARAARIAEQRRGVHSGYAKIAAQAAVSEPELAPSIHEKIFVSGQALTESAAAQALAVSIARRAQDDDELGQLISRQLDLETQIAELDDAIVSSYLTDTAAARNLPLDQIKAKTAELEDLNAEIRRRYPAYLALTSAKPLSFSSVRSLLQEDEGLLFYFTGRPDLFVVGITKKAVAVRRIREGWLANIGRIDRLRCQVDRETCQKRERAALDKLGIPLEPAAPEPGRPFDLDTAYRLYRDIVAPVEGAFASAKRLYVVTAGPIGDLPLGLLVTSLPNGTANGDEALRQATWLSDRYAITRLPSVGSLALRAKRQMADNSFDEFVGYGDPALCDETKPCPEAKAAAAIPSTQTNPTAIDRDELMRLGSLPGTRQELQTIATSFAPANSRLVLRDAATEAAFKADASLRSARTIAIATHGLLPGEVARLREPGLVFTPPPATDSSDDGYLAASEITKMTLSADWVILSACNTATAGDTGAGDSLSALSRAFFFAGSRALLASHWRVDDIATAMLTSETLRIARHAPQLTKAQSLQLAMRTVRTGKRADGSAVDDWDPAFVHPSFWAAFSHIAYRDD